MTSAYPNFQAVGRPLQFRGLKGRFILLAAGALVTDLLLFVILYCCGIPPWLCILLVFGLGAGALWAAAALSKRFGSQGLMKHLAAKRLPKQIRLNSRQVFFTLLKK